MSNRESFLPGYSGRDAMRMKAENMFGKKMLNGGPVEPPSASAPGLEKMRPYKKGGAVKRHPLSKEQSDMKIPTRIKTPRLAPKSFEEAEGMKHGGRSVRHQMQKRAERKRCYSEGGAVRKGGATHVPMVGEHPIKFAAGGVGKIRHKAATAKGMPLKRKRAPKG
jgi:hypothetical protein